MEIFKTRESVLTAAVAQSLANETIKLVCMSEVGKSFDENQVQSKMIATTTNMMFQNHISNSI